MQILTKYFKTKKQTFIDFFQDIQIIIQKLNFQVQTEIDNQYKRALQQLQQISSQLVEQFCIQLQNAHQKQLIQIVDSISKTIKLKISQNKVSVCKNGHENSGNSKRDNQPYRVEYVKSQFIDSKNLQIISKKNSYFRDNNRDNKLSAQIKRIKTQDYPMPENYKQLQQLNKNQDEIRYQNSLNSNLNKSNLPLVKHIQSQFVDNRQKIQSGFENNERDLNYKTTLTINNHKNQQQFIQPFYNSYQNNQRNHLSRSQFSKPLKASQKNVFNSPQKHKSKQKMSIIKKPEICESLDKLINKQAKQLLHKSQSNKKFNSNSIYSNLKKSNNRSPSRNSSPNKTSNKKGIHVHQFDKILEEKMGKAYDNYQNHRNFSSQHQTISPIQKYKL